METAVGSLVGRKITVRFDHLFDVVSFSAVITRDVDGHTVTARIPQRVRRLQWAPEIFRNALVKFPRPQAIRALRT